MSKMNLLLVLQTNNIYILFLYINLRLVRVFVTSLCHFWGEGGFVGRRYELYVSHWGEFGLGPFGLNLGLGGLGWGHGGSNDVKC